MTLNVKRYRAATIPDALEKVKSELGDEALVLGSRSVRRRGISSVSETFETIEMPSVNRPQPKRDSLLAEVDRLRAEVREVKFTLTRPTQNVADGDNFSYNIDDCNSVIYDSPYYETYLYLAGLGLTPDIARAAIHAAINTGTKAQNELELAETGLVHALPSLIQFGSAADATLTIEKFGLFAIHQLVIKRLDETGRPAAAISTAAAASLPLAYLCTGQPVPEDIERATPKSLARNALQTTAAAIAAA